MACSVNDPYFIVISFSFFGCCCCSYCCLCLNMIDNNHGSDDNVLWWSGVVATGLPVKERNCPERLMFSNLSSNYFCFAVITGVMKKMNERKTKKNI